MPVDTTVTSALPPEFAYSAFVLISHREDTPAFLKLAYSWSPVVPELAATAKVTLSSPFGRRRRSIILVDVSFTSSTPAMSCRSAALSEKELLFSSASHEPKSAKAATRSSARLELLLTDGTGRLPTVAGGSVGAGVMSMRLSVGAGVDGGGDVDTGGGWDGAGDGVAAVSVAGGSVTGEFVRGGGGGGLGVWGGVGGVVDGGGGVRPGLSSWSLQRTTVAQTVITNIAIKSARCMWVPEELS
jgi:hypothetical protein